LAEYITQKNNKLLDIPWRVLQNIHSITVCLPGIKHVSSTVIPMDWGNYNIF